MVTSKAVELADVVSKGSALSAPGVARAQKTGCPNQA